MRIAANREIILEVENLRKEYPLQKGLFQKQTGTIRAVDGVSFSLEKGKTLGLVGESGCGKTTTGRCITRLIEPSAGQIHYRDSRDAIVNITELDRKQIRDIRREIQIIFQDPVSSLDPRMSIYQIVEEPLRINKVGSRKERVEIVKELLGRVHLSSETMGRYPHEFSGGQRQRIGLARAMALNPRVIVCDEPVSALDVSIQAQIINLLCDLQQELKLSYLFISHDLNVIYHISNDVAVMYLGKLVEFGHREAIFDNPLHPYTEALLKSILVVGQRMKLKKDIIEGDLPDLSKRMEGCTFSSRCSYAQQSCRELQPELREHTAGGGHYVACHRAEVLALQGFDKANALPVTQHG